MKSHLEKINQFLSELDDRTQSALNAVAVRRTFRKGEYLLRQDEICRHSFLIEKGIARKFHLTADGKEITTDIFFDGDLAVAFQSYTLQNPSREFIQTLEETGATITDYQSFQRLKTAFPKLLELDLMMTEYYAMWLEERFLQTRTLDAAERYRRLVKEHPHYIEKVQLTLVASYLGISLETLSRVRAKI